MIDARLPHQAPQAGGVIFLSAHDTQGGTINYIKTLRQRFEHEGISCHSLALYSGFISDPSGFDEVITPQRKLSTFAYFKAIAGFVSRVRQFSPAVILTVMPMANVAAGLAGWFSKSKVVCTQHSPHDKNGRLVGLLDMMMGTLGAYDSIVCVSNAVAQSYSRHPSSYRKRLKVIPNSISPLDPDTAPADVRTKYRLTSDRHFGLAVGRLVGQKNMVRTVEAMSSIEEADFLIAGAGPLEGEVRSTIDRLGATDRVRLIGALERQEVINLLHTCDVFVQASLFEGQSLALLEAVHARAGLVVSDIPEQLEVVISPAGPAAILCDPYDPEDIAHAIRAMLFDATRREEVAANLAALAPNIRTEGQMLDDYWRILGPLFARTKSAEADTGSDGWS